ncbi:MAG: hypothetical protein FWB97_02565, partial [Oscillospiraceae bacterium]|nr:hypothetical protein [Oscillospiraceae bacterium]
PPPPPPPPPSDDAPPVDFGAFGRLTRPASDAAKRILRGVRRGDLYIVTHSEFKAGFEERVNAMLRAFPDEVPNEEFKKLFSFLVSNPVFNKQTQVPALEG